MVDKKDGFDKTITVVKTIMYIALTIFILAMTQDIICHGFI